jgi:Cytochrome bd-type quinol oxidase, subunit 1
VLDGLSAELLARIQFAFTVSFHIIFPAFSIGLASYLAVLNGLWLWKRDAVYLNLFNYWEKDIRRGLRHGGRFGNRHVLPIRHKLGGFR